MRKFIGKVSIIIPAHQEGIWLENTLRSIAANTKYPGYEIIIIDDASTDDCAKDLEAMWSDMNPVSGSSVKTLVVKANEEHGPAVSRNRGLLWADGELIVTLDAHMALSPEWLTRLVEVHEKYPDAFLMGCSTGFRDVEDLKKIPCGDESIPIDVPRLEEAKEANPNNPLILDIPSKLKGLFGEKNQQKQAMALYGLPVNWSKDEYAILRVKGHNLATVNPTFKGCMLDYDPEDRGFITPKWAPWHKRGRIDLDDNNEVARMNAFMGACYLFPRKLFDDRIGGWPRYSGWIHEEPYLSIASGIQDIPILCVKSVVAAHNYDRVNPSPQNLDRQRANQKACVEICFEDMKPEIWREIFKEEYGNTIYPDWVSEYREKVQAGRKMSDVEFLVRAGLHWFFIPKYRKLAVKRLGVASSDLSTGGKAAIQATIDSIIQNARIQWIGLALKYQDLPSQSAQRPESPDKAALRESVWLFCANLWDAAKKCRSNQVDYELHAEMIGEFEQLLTVEKLKGRIGLMEFGKVLSAILRPMPATGAQPDGDIIPIKE